MRNGREYKRQFAERERLQESLAFASDPDLGSEKLATQARQALTRFERKIGVQQNKVVCPSCGRDMVKRSGKYGEFYGCTGYPNCKVTLNLRDVRKQLERLVPAKPKEFTPSHLQQAVFDFITDGYGNAVVEAVAGSGKTTTIVEALKLTSGSVLFCAFNKHIQRELARRAPNHVQVSTIHSIGFRALSEALPVKPTLDNSKLYGIVKELLPLNEDYPLRQPLARLVSLCKKTLTDYTNPKAIEYMADHYDIDLNGNGEKVIELVPQAMKMCAERLTVIDYDDMIWLPNALGIGLPTFDWVFVDEAQDLSKAQSAIVRKSVKENGRVVAVGDRHQSIYGFTGADTQSIPRLIEELDAKTMPLSITYRCPKSVVKLAQNIVSQIEAAEWAGEGEVIDVPRHVLESRLQDRDLVVSRVNAPLVKLCYSLIRQGKKAVIRGRDIGKGLLNLIDKLKPVDILDLLDRVKEYRCEQTARLDKAGKEHKIEAVQDRCDCIIELCDGIRDLTELRSRIREIFDDNENNGVILSSIHRAKGDEADTVYVLTPGLLPHPLAKKDWQIEQERNLEYVAYTRAKKVLAFIR